MFTWWNSTATFNAKLLQLNCFLKFSFNFWYSDLPLSRSVTALWSWTDWAATSRKSGRKVIPPRPPCSGWVKNWWDHNRAFLDPFKSIDHYIKKLDGAGAPAAQIETSESKPFEVILTCHSHCCVSMHVFGSGSRWTRWSTCMKTSMSTQTLKLQTSCRDTETLKRLVH